MGGILPESKRIMGLEMWKKLQYHRLEKTVLGWGWLGDAQIGISAHQEDDLLDAGIYQRLPHKTGKIIITRDFFRSSYPGTDDQLQSNQVFADAVAAWQSLTQEEKASYNRIAKRRQRQGYNFFISQYILANN